MSPDGLRRRLAETRLTQRYEPRKETRVPRAYIYETAITIDHETGVMLVDTSVTGVASQLLRAGFAEVTEGRSRPYRRFRGGADQLRFRRPKGQRVLRGAARVRLESLSESVQAA